jgi:hypothetical protein
MLPACVLLWGTLGSPHAENPQAASHFWGRTARPAVATAPSQAVGPFFVGPRLPPATAPAATPPSESERLQEDLLHTERLLRVLRAKIQRSENPTAQDRFAAALKRQGEARDAFDQNHLARASRLTLEARTMARDSAFMVGPPEDDPAYVARALDRAGEALTLALEVFDRGASPSVWSRYHGLKNDLTHARELHKGGNTREAYRKGIAVRDAVLDLLTQTDDLPIPAGTASKALRRVEKAIDRAVKDMGPSPKEDAARWQRAASGHLAKAKQSYARKDYRSAVIYAKLAVRVLDQAVTAQRNGVKSDAS